MDGSGVTNIWKICFKYHVEYTPDVVCLVWLDIQWKHTTSQVRLPVCSPSISIPRALRTHEWAPTEWMLVPCPYEPGTPHSPSAPTTNLAFTISMLLSSSFVSKCSTLTCKIIIYRLMGNRLAPTFTGYDEGLDSSSTSSDIWMSTGCIERSSSILWSLIESRKIVSIAPWWSVTWTPVQFKGLTQGRWNRWQRPHHEWITCTSWPAHNGGATCTLRDSPSETREYTPRPDMAHTSIPPSWLGL